MITNEREVLEQFAKFMNKDGSTAIYKRDIERFLESKEKKDGDL